MIDHKSEPALTPILFGLQRAGKTSAIGALCEIEMARYFPLVIFDLQDDHLSLVARSPHASRRSRSRRNAP